MEQVLNFTFKGNIYSIEFPNIGKYRSIETLKQALSNGMYSAMMNANTISSLDALDMIDAEAYLSVLCPKLIKDLKCDSFSELGLFDWKELKKEYDAQFIPWWSEIMKELNPKKEG